MRTKIYQINTDRDINKVKFSGLQQMAKHKNNIVVDASIYDNVFDAEIDKMPLESVYEMFNTKGHPLFRGHSLSVSDIVCTPNGAFFCDTVGFKKIDFDESQTQKTDNLLKIVYVEPHKSSYVTEIENSLAGEQKAVQGMIECIYNGDNTIIIGNDEAKLIGMDGNRHLDNGTSIIAGPFFVVGDGGEDFRSLTDEEVDKYINKFSEIEEISQEETMADMGFEIYGIDLGGM